MILFLDDEYVKMNWRVLSLQIELFAKVFTMIGKDISGSSCLTELMHHLRDAFLCSHSLDEDGNYNSTLR